jgi:hypothetical protein
MSLFLRVPRAKRCAVRVKEELMERSTGKPLTTAQWTTHVPKKFGALNGLNEARKAARYAYRLLVVPVGKSDPHDRPPCTEPRRARH